MAYRRKQSSSRSSTFEDFTPSPAEEEEQQQPPSLAAQAIRASSAHRDSSLSSAYGESAFSSAPNRQRPSPQDSTSYEYTSMKSLNESKHGFWGVLARKAKSIIEDDHARQLEESGRNHPQMHETAPARQLHQSYRSTESYRKADNQAFHKGSETLAYIGGTIKTAFEEGLTIVENRTADIIEETRKLQIRRKSSGRTQQNPNPGTEVYSPRSLAQSQYDHETQLKASRDVANAMAAKAKLLLRELKTVKADLAFAKERCAQLEEENKILRESREKGDNTEDDDLIRLQLETLLSEKGRLAHENSVYARENRFLREIVEYHQLTMQDVVYLDEGNEEVTEVCSIHSHHEHSPTHSLDEESSPVISGRSTPTSKPSTPTSPNRVASPQAFHVVSDPPKSPLTTVTETSAAEADSTPAAKDGRQQQTESKPSTPRAVDSAKSPQHSPTRP